jgi:hypothetical protein
MGTLSSLTTNFAQWRGNSIEEVTNLVSMIFTGLELTVDIFPFNTILLCVFNLKSINSNPLGSESHEQKNFP